MSGNIFGEATRVVEQLEVQRGVVLAGVGLAGGQPELEGFGDERLRLGDPTGGQDPSRPVDRGPPAEDRLTCLLRRLFGGLERPVGLLDEPRVKGGAEPLVLGVGPKVRVPVSGVGAHARE